MSDDAANGAHNSVPGRGFLNLPPVKPFTGDGNSVGQDMRVWRNSVRLALDFDGVTPQDRKMIWVVSCLGGRASLDLMSMKDGDPPRFQQITADLDSLVTWLQVTFS